MKRFCCIAVLLGALAMSGCTTQVHSDYPQYLANNQGSVNFPNVANSVQYYLDPATENHSVSVRSFMAGAANSWVVQFGRILDATMNSGDFRAAFDTVEKTSSREGIEGLFLVFSLRNYQFANLEASASLNISAYSDGREVLSKYYNATGISQGGKMFWGGAFAMKNAIQQSTKNVIDQILKEFLDELKRAMAAQT